MSDATACAETFASGRYSKRKRTQVAYRLDELDYSDTESDFASPPAKVRCTTPCATASSTNCSPAEAQSQSMEKPAPCQAEHFSISATPCRDPQHNL